MIALGAPPALWLAGEGARREDLHPIIRRAYTDQEARLAVADETEAAAADGVAWLVRAWD